MIDCTLLSHCKNVAARIAPELQEDPLYIVDGSSSIFAGLPIPQQCLGWADNGQLPDYEIRERLGDMWAGPGRIVALNSAAILEASGEDRFRDAVLNVLLHELAHLLPRKPLSPEYADLLDCELVREWLADKRAEADAEPKPPPGSEQDMHNADFVRICTHLLGRSKLAGWDIPSDNLYGGDCSWFLCQPPHWVFALMREIIELRDATFTDILATDPGLEFSGMYEAALRVRLRREAKNDH